MMIKGIKQIFSVAIFLVVVQVGWAQTSINYSSTNAVIANPERGWYNHTQTWDVDYSPINAETLKKNREKDKTTLILRLFYLRGFVNTDSVSDEYRENMQADFDSIRSAGVKCIVRFAYSAAQTAEVWDAAPEKVYSHIESLAQVLYKNSDVIAGVQAGFIGVWGEWYYTKNFAGAGYQPSEQDQVNRRILIEKLLAVLPEHVTVQCRTPAIMRNANESDEPIATEIAFDGSFKSRVGHHNDCFLADATDYGTYTNKEVDMPYLNQSTKYTIAGGETCDPSNTYSDCDNSLERMKEFHWTYLNSDYNQTVYNKWKDQDCFNEVNLALGYRISLLNATISDSSNANESVRIDLKLTNQGFAAPTQYKPIQFIFTHTLTNQEVVLPYVGDNDDIRYWLPGEININSTLQMPDSMPVGNYTMQIAFPDQDPTLANNPAYAIQLANRGLWNNVEGTNSLNHIITMGSEGLGALPETPVGIDANPYDETSIEVSWADEGSDEITYEIMRAEEGDESWVHIATVDNGENDYLDVVADKHTEYNYCVRAVNKYGSSDWSAVASAQIQLVNIPDLVGDDFEIIPNPLLGTDLLIGVDKAHSGQLIITDLSGIVVYKGSVHEGVITIDRRVFSSGIYVVSIISNDRVTSKILIVH